jgi:hypothetical protein
MPIHDWTRVDAGLFHAFHLRWIAAISDRLNDGVLPEEYFALPEQNIRGPIPDVLALQLSRGNEEVTERTSGIAVAEARPVTRLVQRSEAGQYADLANRITVRHRHGEVVAVIEIVSPGNKGSRNDLRQFVQKSVDLIGQGIHLLLVDPFPPGPRDPKGLHQLIWQEFSDEAFTFPEDKPLTMAAYDAGFTRVAYVDFIAVDDPLPSLPLFLEPERYVPAPLEETYQTAWKVFPKAMKGLLAEPPTK